MARQCVYANIMYLSGRARVILDGSFELLGLKEWPRPVCCLGDLAGECLGMLPMIGQICGRVFDVSSVSIHGDEYFDVMVQTAVQEELGQGTRFRVAKHALVGGRAPVRGSVVELSLLMQQVTSLRVVSDESSGGGGSAPPDGPVGPPTAS